MSYTGTTHFISCAKGGLNYNQNEDDIPPTDLIDGSKNINFHEGGFRKRGGTAHISTEIDSGERLRGIFDYLKAAGSQYVVFATNNGKVWKSVGNTIKTGPRRLLKN